MTVGLALAFALAAGPIQQAGITAEGVTTSVRPAQVRVGGRVVLTVRVEYAFSPPEAIEFVEAGDVEILDVIDRQATASGVPGISGWWERDFVLVPWAAPATEWVVEITDGDNVVSIPVDPPAIQPAGAWDPLQGGRREARSEDEGRVVPEGTPPPVSRELGRVTPGDLPPGSVTTQYGPPGYGRDPRRPPGAYPPGYGPSGYGPPGNMAAGAWLQGGWAETADADPWWREIVPELLRYDAVTEDASRGFPTLQ